MITPSKVEKKRPTRYSLEDNCAGCCGCEVVIAENGEYVEFEDFESLETELAKLQKQRDHLLLQVQSQSMEMRTHKTIVHEIYQVLMGATGEPGNWNGAEPARKVMTELADTRRALEMAIEGDRISLTGSIQEDAENYLNEARKERGQ